MRQRQGCFVASAARNDMPLLAAMTDTRRFAVVILAAGQGTRMRSDTHKVLHPIASRLIVTGSHAKGRGSKPRRAPAASGALTLWKCRIGRVMAAP